MEDSGKQRRRPMRAPTMEGLHTAQAKIEDATRMNKLQQSSFEKQLEGIQIDRKEAEARLASLEQQLDDFRTAATVQQLKDKLAEVEEALKNHDSMEEHVEQFGRKLQTHVAKITEVQETKNKALEGLTTSMSEQLGRNFCAQSALQERLDYLEKLMGDSAGRHALDLAALDQKIQEQMTAALSALEGQAGTGSLLTSEFSRDESHSGRLHDDLQVPSHMSHSSELQLTQSSTSLQERFEVLELQFQRAAEKQKIVEDACFERLKELELQVPRRAHGSFPGDDLSDRLEYFDHQEKGPWKRRKKILKADKAQVQEDLWDAVEELRLGRKEDAEWASRCFQGVMHHINTLKGQLQRHELALGFLQGFRNEPSADQARGASNGHVAEMAGGPAAVDMSDAFGQSAASADPEDDWTSSTGSVASAPALAEQSGSWIASSTGDDDWMGGIGAAVPTVKKQPCLQKPQES